MRFIAIAILLTATLSACSSAEKSSDEGAPNRTIECAFPQNVLRAEVDELNHLTGKLHYGSVAFTREQVGVFSYEPGRVLAATAYRADTKQKLTVRAGKKGDTKNAPAGASIELCKVVVVKTAE